MTRWLTPVEAAEILAVTPKTIRRMRLRGELKGITVGTRVRIDAGSLPTPYVRKPPRRRPAPSGHLSRLVADLEAEGR